MKFRALVLSLVGAALLAGCGNSGTYYEKPPEKILGAIEKATLPTALMGRNVVGSTATKPDANTLVVTANDQFGGDVFRIVARVTPEGEGAYVAASFENLHEQQGASPGLMQKFADEYVAAAIDGRPFDMMFASSPVAKAMINSDTEIGKRAKAASEAATAFSKLQQEMHQHEQREKFRDEYGDDWAASGNDYGDGWAE